MDRLKLLKHTRTAVRVMLFSGIGVGTVAGAGFLGVHTYIESQDPTPSSWPWEKRFAYRAAAFNYHYLDQPLAAKSSLTRLLEDEASELTPGFGDSERTMDHVEKRSTASRNEGIGKAYFLRGRIYRQQGDLTSAMRDFTKALAFTAGNSTLQSDIARSLGQLADHCGMVSTARYGLELAISLLFPAYQSDMPIRLQSSVTYPVELLDGLKAFAVFQAKQGKLKDALSLLLLTLRHEQNHPKITSKSCKTAATMSDIAEIVWALGDTAECKRWSLEALEVATNSKNKSKSYCLECAGISQNTLGLLALAQGNSAEARSLFGRAIVSAERAMDDIGLQTYLGNLEKCV